MLNKDKVKNKLKIVTKDSKSYDEMLERIAIFIVTKFTTKKKKKK